MKRIVVSILAVIGGVSILCGLCWLFTLTPIWKGLTLTFDVSYEELPRVASPDGSFEIVVIRSDAGVTTSYGYEIFVVPKGQVVDRKRDEMHLVFRSLARTRLLDYRWRGQSVEIRVVDGPVGFRHSYYGRRLGFDLQRAGSVVLTVVDK